MRYAICKKSENKEKIKCSFDLAWLWALSYAV